MQCRHILSPHYYWKINKNVSAIRKPSVFMSPTFPFKNKNLPSILLFILLFALWNLSCSSIITPHSVTWTENIQNVHPLVLKHTHNQYNVVDWTGLWQTGIDHINNYVLWHDKMITAITRKLINYSNYCIQTYPHENYITMTSVLCWNGTKFMLTIKKNIFS